MSRLLLWITLILIVIVRIVSVRPQYNDGDLIRISSRISTEPTRKGDLQYLRVQGLVVRLPAFPAISYGDTVVITGRVNHPFVEGAVLESHNTSSFALYSIREQIIAMYKRALPEPHASLVSGVVIGARSGIPESFYDDLRKTGTAHVVVASGMNVAFVAQFLVSVLVLFIHRQKAVLISLVGVWGYVALSGFDAPLIRAGIMGSIAFSAQASNRLASSLRSLFLSGALMLIVFPHWLVDVGFILSFLATYSLIAFERPINRLIHFVPAIFRESLSTSLAAQIGVTPILMSVFGSVSLVGPLVNALILWTIPPIMLVGSFAAFAGLIAPRLGALIALLVYPLTWWFVQVVRLFA